MNEANPTIQRLLEANPLREPVLRSAMQALELPFGSHGLDVGCGIGLQAMLLAEVVAPRGNVHGVDIDPEILAFGDDLVRKAGFAGRVLLREGDMRQLPFPEGSFDWVWSADCAGYPLGELLPILEELKRVVRPGGSINLLAWSSQQVLPGYSLLEARLNATCSAYLPYLEGKDPELQFLRGLRWFEEAGLEEVKAQTFVGEVRAPLEEDLRVAVASLFEMLWGTRQPKVSAQDWDECQRLCRPESPDFILDRPGYYAFFTYTMFRGKVPQDRLEPAILRGRGKI